MSDPDNTQRVLLDMHRERRRGRVMVWLAIGGIAALVAFWGGTTCSHISEEREKIYSDGMSEQARAAAFQLDPLSDVAKVYIVMDGKGRLAVNGKDLGEFQHTLLELAPGKHKVTAKLQRATMTQPLDVREGEEFLVDFVQAKGKVHVRRLQRY